MRNYFKKIIKSYDSISAIDGILCGILMFAVIRPPLAWIFVIATLGTATITFGVITLSRKERNVQPIEDFIRGLSSVVFLASLIQIAIAIINK